MCVKLAPLPACVPWPTLTMFHRTPRFVSGLGLRCCMVFSCGLTSHGSDRSGGASRGVESSVVADMTESPWQFDADEFDDGNDTVWVCLTWRSSQYGVDPQSTLLEMKLRCCSAT